MKKILLSFALLCSIIIQGQNKDFIISLEKLDIAGVRKFSNQIANNCKTKWEFLKIVEDEKHEYCRVVYLDASYSSELKKKIQSGQEICDNCLRVDFSLFFDGANKDLEIIGIKKYRFTEFTGKYLDIFPTWQLYFKPGASLEDTLTNYDNQELKDKVIGIHYKITKQGNTWLLHNHSNLFEYFKTHP